MIDFAKLCWPKKMNLQLLLKFMPEDVLKTLITDNAYKPRLERRIILPSHKCIRKVLFYYLVEKHDGDYDKVMAEIKGDFRTLKMLDVSRQKVREFYAQRKREIAREK